MNNLGIDCLLSVNRPPTAAEKSQIEAVILQEESDILRLDSRIEETEAVLSVYKQQRNKRLQRARNLGQVLSPVRRLPPELLAEVFLWHQALWCNEAEGVLAPLIKKKERVLNVDQKPRDSLLLMCQICSYWRRVAITTPGLWKRLDMFLDNANVERKTNRHSLTTWFNRVELQGSVHVCLRGSIGLRVNPVASIVLSPAAGNLIGSISLSDFPASFYSQLFKPETVWQSPAALTKLHSLTLDSMNRGMVDVHMMHLQWSALTFLDFNCINVPLSSLYAALVLCTKLETFRGRTHNNNSKHWHPSTSHTELLRLKLLHLDIQSDTPICRPFFDIFTFPALKDLSLGLFGEFPWHAENTLAFKKRSLLDLERFQLDGPWGATSLQMEQFLQDMPSLQILIISMDAQCIDNHFVSALTFPSTSGTPKLGPHLRSIWLPIDPEEQNDLDLTEVLFPMIDSRCPTANEKPQSDRTFLESVSFSCSEEMDEDVYYVICDWAEGWKKRGLEVNIIT